LGSKELECLLADWQVAMLAFGNFVDNQHQQPLAPKFQGPEIDTAGKHPWHNGGTPLSGPPKLLDMRCVRHKTRRTL
jgi:hypothetical protein